MFKRSVIQNAIAHPEPQKNQLIPVPIPATDEFALEAGKRLFR
ncbi:hypothetical protein [Microcoleus sp. FACHB-SPT15]|nr:hypothetical protein [Microcoleus sp. FACHB-SPT15]